ncbi:MAG: DegT/DnrJ/EryC1/StrS family aminotransferase [candidate division NC10 bacterium]|nr:DegT/DnrJ/EryC1/StrS family aminotransferase [candidate division NC10 bacterium]
MKIRYPFLKPNIPKLAQMLPDLQEVYRNGCFTNMGPFERLLTAKIGECLDGMGVAVVSNCTAGLMLGLRATVNGKRREVLVPSYTFVATVSAIDWVGLMPLFADVDALSWQMDPSHEKDILKRKDKIGAVLLCNTFGSPSDVESWREIARRLDVPLLIDSAAGFGGQYGDGTRQGTKGTAEFFSMHATKPFAVGEGGIVASQDADLIARIEDMKNFGLNRERISQFPGLNAKLTEFQAIIGLHSLRQLPSSVERRRAAAARYRHCLRGFAFQEKGEFSTYPFFPALSPIGKDRDRIIRHAAARAVQLRDYYAKPVHAQPFGRRFPKLNGLPVTNRLAQRAVCLPMYDDIGENDIEAISRVVNEA